LINELFETRAGLASLMRTLVLLNYIPEENVQFLKGGRGYREMPFPFHEIEAPEFQIEVHWSLTHLLGYLRTWSATQRFVAANGRDPVELVESDLEGAWGNPTERKPAIWPLTVRLGRA